MLALTARCSKYDFWIPDEILTLEKNPDHFFSRLKMLIEKKKRKNGLSNFFFVTKNQKIEILKKKTSIIILQR